MSVRVSNQQACLSDVSNQQLVCQMCLVPVDYPERKNSMFHFVYADNRGNAYDHPEYLALGRLGQNIVEPDPEEFIPMPEGFLSINT